MNRILVVSICEILVWMLARPPEAAPMPWSLRQLQRRLHLSGTSRVMEGWTARDLVDLVDGNPLLGLSRFVVAVLQRF